MLYVLFGEKDLVCDETMIKDVIKELFSLGYTVLNRGKLADDTWSLEVRRQ